MNRTPDAVKQALIQALAKLEYHTVVYEDGGMRIWYNGRFVDINISNRFVRIWDLFWRTFCPGDIGLSHIKEAVDSANMTPSASIVYSCSEDKELTYLNSKVDFMFNPEIPHPESYVDAHLKALDLIKESFNSHLNDYTWHLSGNN